MPTLASERDIDPAAVALASQVGDCISAALGRYIREMAEGGVTRDQIQAKLRRAVECAEHLEPGMAVTFDSYGTEKRGVVDRIANNLVWLKDGRWLHRASVRRA